MRPGVPRATPGFPEPRRFVPPEPSERPTHRRRAVRVFVRDPAGRLLLFQDSDLGMDPVVHWWVTPGGGVEEGESDVDAVVRELFEETGLRLTTADVIGPLAARHVIHGYSDQVTLQEEIFFAVEVAPFEVDTSGHTAQELEVVHDIRWWSRAELESREDDVWPRSLEALLALADTHVPGTPSRRLPPSEESTLPS